jgi:hypothetical protein
VHPRPLQGLLGDPDRRRRVRWRRARWHQGADRVRLPTTHIDGGWTETIIIDTSATADQRRALQTIFTGAAGGPWAKLAAFVSNWQPIEFRPIVIADEGATKRAMIVDRLKTVVSQIRGRDRSKPVLFENIFNQIHAPTQVIALGDAEYDDGAIRFANTQTHGLFSEFDWAV